MKLDPTMFHKSLDSMLGQLMHLSDNDIGKSIFDDQDGDEIDHLGAKPIGGIVEITKVSGGPNKGLTDGPSKLGSSDHSDMDNEFDPDNDGDDDNLRGLLDSIEGMSGEKVDTSFRDPRELASHYAGDDNKFDRSNVGIRDPRLHGDQDDDTAFPEEKIARFLGNKKF